MPSLELLTTPGDGPCMLRGSIPARLAELAARDGHWLATPEENTAIDLEEVLP